MNIKELKAKPIWQMTGEEFLLLQKDADTTKPERKPTKESSKKYVYGIQGLAQLFGCSVPTAHRIKKSGKINKAVTQIGRKIIIDAELALELAGQKTGGRK